MAQGNKVININPAPGTGSNGVKDVTYDNATNQLTVTDGGGGTNVYTLEDEHVTGVAIVGTLLRIDMAPCFAHPAGSTFEVDFKTFQADWDAITGSGVILNKPHNTDFQGDWIETDQSSLGFIKNKPTSHSQQSDWTETDNSLSSFIVNKPGVLTYQSDWEESAHLSPNYVQNKPPLATMGFVNDEIIYTSQDLSVTKIDLSGYENEGRTVGGQYLHATKELELYRNDSTRFTIDVTGLDGEGVYIPITEKGQPNGVATLDALGKIPAIQIPAMALTNTFVVPDEATMLSTTPVNEGDLFLVTDQNKMFIYNGNGEGSLANYMELVGSAAAGIKSVNGDIGPVVVIDLVDLPSVDITTTAPLDGQVLKFDAAAGKWIPGSINPEVRAFDFDATSDQTMFIIDIPYVAGMESNVSLFIEGIVQREGANRDYVLSAKSGSPDKTVITTAETIDTDTWVRATYVG